MKETLKYSFILGLICLLSSGILAVVNAVTDPEINRQMEREGQSALEEVMPQAAEFKPRLKAGKTDYYLAYDKNNKLIGFVVKSEGRGYSSEIQSLAGLDRSLNITGVKILSQNETPGLGNKIRDPSFLERFKGRDLDSFGKVEAITGATISSTAVIDSVKNKIEELKGQLLKELQ